MSDRVLLTGAGGFVGRVLHQLLLDVGYNVIGTTGGAESQPGQVLDIRDRSAVSAFFKREKPSRVIHLAAISNVPFSFKDPVGTWQTNVMGTMNLLSAIKEECPEAFLLYVSSSEVYGEAFKHAVPLTEASPCIPMNPYAASKLAGEIAVQQFFRSGGRGVIARPFNHIGAGQSPDFVTASFAKQIAEIEKRTQKSSLSVGNLDASRDFLDVRDVSSAYIELLKLVDQNLDDRVFNISSGVPVRVSQVLQVLLGLSSEIIVVQQDAERMRPSDIFIAVGDSTRIRALTCWAPKYNLTDTLSSLLNDWRGRV